MALFFILSELCFKISFVPLKTNQFRQVSLYRFVIGHFLLLWPYSVYLKEFLVSAFRTVCER